MARYETLTPEGHVRHRPGMYIGSTLECVEKRWVMSESSSNMEYTDVCYNPGLYKIICEAIDNAGDHAERTGRVTYIKIYEKDGEITVHNDGPGIDSSLNEEHNMHTPQMIFGKLFTSSNYNDNEERTWIGTNGIGVKATNIFSEKFKVETVKDGTKYIQRWKNGMKDVGKPSITSTTSKDYTKITFTPDYEFFKITEIQDTLKVVHKRTIDLALFSKDVSVYWNNKKVTSHNFAKYMKLYIQNNKAFTFENRHWMVGFAMTPFSCYTQVSYVNGSPTQEGGTHVDHVVNPVVKQITEQMQSKHKDLTIRSNYVKDNLFVVICCKMTNPTFDSQTKNKLQNKIFKNKLIFNREDIKKIMKLGITDNIAAIANAKAIKAINKDIGKKKNKIQ